MPKPSRFSGFQQSGVPRVARRLRKRMNELGLSQVALAARCTCVAQDLFPEDQIPQITRERIAKILMHCKCNPGKSAARVISQNELQVLSTVLQVSPEWLRGQNGDEGLVLWDPLADPARAEHILHLMNEHEESATEALVWAEFLICSLEIPEFMHLRHLALFRELDLLGAHDEKRKLVQIYDNIGNARRKRLLDSHRREQRLVQFIFKSDIERVVRGEGEYANIPKSVRRACLENLGNLLSDSSLKIEFIIADEEDANGAKAAFRDYDSIGLFGESFMWWRYHSGRIAWSVQPDHARRYREMLKAIEARTGARSRADLLMLVENLAESIS